MSAEILRRAASLMRERAEGATPGPWVAQGPMVVADPGPNALYVADCFDAGLASAADARHIASWHPAVALAVADWLDHEVALAEEKARYCNNLIPTSFTADDMPLSRQALAVARGYLGESA